MTGYTYGSHFNLLGKNRQSIFRKCILLPLSGVWFLSCSYLLRYLKIACTPLKLNKEKREIELSRFLLQSVSGTYSLRKSNTKSVTVILPHANLGYLSSAQSSALGRTRLCVKSLEKKLDIKLSSEKLFPVETTCSISESNQRLLGCTALERHLFGVSKSVQHYRGTLLVSVRMYSITEALCWY